MAESKSDPVPGNPRDWTWSGPQRRRPADSVRWFPGWHGPAGAECIGDWCRLRANGWRRHAAGSAGELVQGQFSFPTGKRDALDGDFLVQGMGIEKPEGTHHLDEGGKRVEAWILASINCRRRRKCIDQGPIGHAGRYGVYTQRRPAAESLAARVVLRRVSAGATYSGAATPTRAAVLTSVSQLPSGMGMPFFRRSASIRHSGSPATITSS